ncbi:MAG: hybrid sensor histidine kinase/response regulator [Scytonema sp. PMC 1069.18]|nr:hybrid sensor histidine kinase/response regulator [Scytonema sp. PMC 1069.18]MEC4886705.1 hybrid sensor histidine kinase/response regulator [Scytonema sp. PMC 1070.18]
MITDSSIREQGYVYFLSEAPELLQIIEQELFSLSQDYSVAKVHNLMRAAHTIKGGAANVGLEVISKVAHSLEDVIKVLYNPQVAIDAELQTLLLQAYECLRLPLSAELTGSSFNDEEILQRAASVFAQLQEKLGDALDAETHIPTSIELGFDIVRSIFESGVTQRLESIAEAIKNPEDIAGLADSLRSHAEVFLGLAESLNLPGFGEISKTTLAALEIHPNDALKIAELALADFQQAREDVFAGDRTNGGTPSPALQKYSLVTDNTTDNLSVELTDQFSAKSVAKQYCSVNNCPSPRNPVSWRNRVSNSRLSEQYCVAKGFYQFLTTTNQIHDEPLKPKVAKFYLKVIRYILGWFHHEREIPQEQLSLSLLIPQTPSDNSVNYVETWLQEFFDFVRDEEDRQSLCIYRQGFIFKVLCAVAEFQEINSGSHHEIISFLKNKINLLSQEYKTLSPVTTEEQNWLNRPKFKNLLELKDIPTTVVAHESEKLLESIWGEDIVATSHSQFETNQAEEVTIEDSSEMSKSLVVTEEVVKDMTEAIVDVIAEPSFKISKQLEEKTQPALHSRSNSFIRVDVEGLEHLNYLAGELLIYQRRRNLQDEQLKEIVEQLFHKLERHQKTLNQLRELPLQNQSFASQSKQNFASVDFDSLEMDEYTEFHVTLHSALEETLQLQETTESLDLLIKQSIQIHEKTQRLTLNIIDNIVEARMLPLGSVLNRFPSMVQNLGKLHSKVVDVKLFGSQVLVDKAIAEKLYDPLLHLVRNAFDHGIESQEIRRDRGKPEVGLIELCAYHQGSQTIIEVRDDGQGLNLEKIRKKAIELNFISDEEIARGYNPTEEELLELLFSPGFSTAGKVSEISGRGMGLDIVRSQLHALNGSISVQSIPNQGTTFLLKIPFSMTTDKLMLVQAGGIIYALLLDSIEKILLPSAHTIKEFEGKKILHWNTGKDECIVNVYQMSELIDYNNHLIGSRIFQNKSTIDDTGVTKNSVLLLRHNQELLALEVDQIIGEQELVIRPLGQTISPPKYIYGCSILANGNLILVIDGTLLLASSSQMQAAIDVLALPTARTSEKKALSMSASIMQSTPLLASSTPINQTKSELTTVVEPTQKTAKVVLVVDDAISLRQTLALTLQKFGYQVLQAQNGLEALENLQQHPEVQVIISDLEMPRMNGFEFLSHIQQSSNLANKPVVVLTSRSAEKHRRLAQELGAKAYITKPFLEHEFISVIEGLLSPELKR